MAAATVTSASLLDVVDGANRRISALTGLLDTLRLAARVNPDELRDEAIPNALTLALELVDELEGDVAALGEGCRRVSAPPKINAGGAIAGPDSIN